jgi:hypothetical protein
MFGTLLSMNHLHSLTASILSAILSPLGDVYNHIVTTGGGTEVLYRHRYRNGVANIA